MDHIFIFQFKGHMCGSASQHLIIVILNNESLKT